MAHIRKQVGIHGAVTWQAIVTHKRKQKSATFKTKKLALDWVTKTENTVMLGEHFPERLAPQLRKTVGDAIERYCQDILPHKAKGTQDKQWQILTWWKMNLGDTLLTSVNPALLESYKHILVGKQFSNYTVNLYLSTLAHVFSVAASPIWQWLPHNPFHSVKMLRLDRTRLPLVSADQIRQLLHYAQQSRSKSLYLFLRLALGTGGRKREILDARWGQVNWERGTLTFMHTKSGRNRTVPLDRDTVKMLRQHYDGCFGNDRWYGQFVEGEPIFLSARTHRPQRDVLASFHKVCRMVGVSLRGHDLRHIYASMVAERGKADLATLANLLGHSNLNHTRRYQHLTEAHTAQIVQQMADAVLPPVWDEDCDQES